MSYRRADRGFDTLCFIWQGAFVKGYPETWHNGRPAYAHRVAYEAAHGPLGELTVHHLCGQPDCVNPAHLQALSREDHNGGEGHGKLCRDDAEAIRARVADGETQKAIATEYGVSRALVSLIVRGQRWPSESRSSR